MFVDSKYQNNFFTAMKQTRDNLVLMASAGSGKSTTIEYGAGYLDPQDSTAMFAFNYDIAEALKRRMSNTSQKPETLHISTINSFGWGICRQFSQGVKLDKNRTENLMRTQFDMESPADRAKFYGWKYNVDRLVRLFKANLKYTDVTDSEIIQISDAYGMDIPEKPEFFELTKMVWASSCRSTKIMDFSDQIYQPLRNGWPVPRFKNGLVDELQDLTPAQQALVLAACERFFGVGDRRQAIYAFAGADAASMDNMIQRTQSKVLPLSICYRCPKAVIRLAQKLAPEIEWCDYAPEGIVEERKGDKFREQAEPGDFVLCRVTADLVSGCLGMIRQGKTAMVKGKEIGYQLAGMINRLGVPDQDNTARLLDSLLKFQSEQVSKLEAAGRESAIEALTDRVETVRVLLESEDTVGGVKRRINDIFQDEANGVVFSTIHKAKGLESKRVWILRPDLLPHPKAATPEAQEQERNLQYVAYTRAMFGKGTDGELYFVPKERR